MIMYVSGGDWSSRNGGGVGGGWSSLAWVSARSIALPFLAAVHVSRNGESFCFKWYLH